MSKTFKLEIVTPRSNFYNGEVSLVYMKLAKGYTALLVNHTPFTSFIVPSKFEIEENGTRKAGFIKGGLIYMNREECSVIAEDVLWESDVNKSEAKRKADEIKEKLKDKELGKTQRKELEKLFEFYEVQSK